MYRLARAVGPAFFDLTACVVPGEYRMLPISEEARSVGKPIASLRPERAHGVINQSLKRAVVAIASTPQMRTLATPKLRSHAERGMGAIMAAGSKIVLRRSLVAVALTAAALLPSFAVLATVDSPPSRLAPAGDALAPDTMQTGSIEHPARVAPARQASAPDPFRTRIVVVEWKIKKGREAEFLDYWSTRSTIPDRSGLIGEFLSGVEDRDRFPWINWTLDDRWTTF